MKTLIANTYSKFRTRIDRRIEDVMKTAGIVRLGDHFVCSKLLDQSSIVIDLGANRGHFSELIARAFYSKIYLVEANSILLDAIDIPNSVKINVAITSSDSEFIFYVSSNPEASSLDKNIAAQYGIIEERKVKCISFASLLSQNNISSVDLLKVDIEGAELGLFASMSDDEIRRCKQITVEFHDFMLPETLDETKRVAQRLVDLGYEQFKFSPLDWRRVLFIRKDILPKGSLKPEFNRASRWSVLLDYSYYRMLLPANNLLRGRK